MTSLSEWAERTDFPARHVLRVLNEGGSCLWPSPGVVTALREVGSVHQMGALLGPWGVGKTELVTQLAWEWSRDRRGSARYCTFAGMTEALKDSFDREKSDDETTKAIMGRYKRSGLLVIDEIHIRNNSGWESNLLTSLIDYRYANNKATILIANLNRTQLEYLLGPPAWSRFCETGVLIEVPWPSFRPATPATPR